MLKVRSIDAMLQGGWRVYELRKGFRQKNKDEVIFGMDKEFQRQILEFQQIT